RSAAAVAATIRRRFTLLLHQLRCRRFHGGCTGNELVAGAMEARRRAPSLAAAVQRDRQRVEEHLVDVGQLGLEPLEDLVRLRRSREQPRLDLVDRRQCDELLLERLREPAAAEVPAVELLQEAGRAGLAELAHGLADEEEQLG